MSFELKRRETCPTCQKPINELDVIQAWNTRAECDCKKHYEHAIKIFNSTTEAAEKNSIDLKGKIQKLNRKIAELENELSAWEESAERWMDDYHKLKEKYEPEFLVTSANTAGTDV